jgi:plasmid stabilization system protein ParE
MFPIYISPRFERDFISIQRYLRDEVSEQVAEEFFHKVIASLKPLSDHPESYPPEPRLAHLGNYRVLRMRNAPYKIFYKFTGSAVNIARIFHNRRDYDRIFRQHKF